MKASSPPSIPMTRITSTAAGRQLFRAHLTISSIASSLTTRPGGSGNGPGWNSTLPAHFLGFGTVQDITDKKRAQERLRESEERFRGIFHYAGTGIAILDMEGRFHSCNPAFCAMLGYAEEELRGLTIADIQHPADRDANLEEVRRLVSESVSSFEISSRYLNKDRKIVWGHKHVSLLRNAAGKSTGIIALVNASAKRNRSRCSGAR
jgi:PAS domain S-box-containing protein